MLNRIRQEHLTKDQIDEAASLSAAAFISSPAYSYMVEDKAERMSFLVWLFSRNYWLRLGSDSCRCSYIGNEFVSFFMFVKPEIPHPGLWDMLRAGIFGGMFRYGPGAIRRLVKTKSWFEAEQARVFGARPMIWLERMTVLPTHQGNGIGSQTLGVALKEADDLMLPVGLATQEERNVVFYTRLGFTVVSEEVCPFGEYRNWMMLRAPMRNKKPTEEDDDGIEAYLAAAKMSDLPL